MDHGDLDATLGGRASGWLIARRVPLLALAILAVVAAWLPAQRLSFDPAIENMFAAGDPLLPPFQLLKRTFGGDEVVLAAYVDRELISPQGMARLKELTDRLAQVEGVEAVISLGNLPEPFNVTGPESRSLPLFEGYFVGADRQTTAAVCFLMPQSEAELRSRTIDQLRQIVAAHDPTGVLAGEPVMVVDGFRYVEADGRNLLRISTVLLGLVIVLCFRSLRWTLAPVIVVQTTILWTEAVLVLGNWQLSLISSMLSAIVTVIGVATVLHVLIPFRERRQAGMPPLIALTSAGALVAAPVVWTCLTDVAGFGALMTARVGPVRDFAFMMTIASVLALVSTAVLLPGLALLGRIDLDPQRAWGEGKLDVGLDRLIDVLLRRPRTYGVLCFAIATIISAGSYWLEVESDFTRNFRERSPIVQSYQVIEARMGGAGVWDVVLPAPEELSLSYLRRVRKLQDRLRKEVQITNESGETVLGLTKVLSLVDALDKRVNFDLVPRALQGQAVPRALGRLDEEVPVLAKSLRGEDPNNAGQHYYRIMLRARERQPSAIKFQLIEQVERISREEFPEAQVTGYFVLLTHLIDSLLGDQWLAFGIATLGIWLMALMALRNLRLSLIAMVPNQLPIMMVMGLMGWLGLKINMGAAMIAAVSLGLSVDSSIHYLLDFSRLRKAGHSLEAALHEAHQSVGRVAVFATLALVVGFGALAFSEFVPTIYFGVLIALAMLGGLVGNLVMLPLLLAIGTREPAKVASA